MKKIIKKSFYLLVVMAICLVLSSGNLTKASAQSYQPKEFVSNSTEYLEDGNYVVTEIYEAVLPSRGVGARMGEKTVTKYSATNSVLWTYKLIGYFSFEDGISSSCYNATYEVDIKGSSWSFSNGNAYYSGNTAFGQGLFTYKFLGITTQSTEIDIYLTCDTYGNIS